MTRRRRARGRESIVDHLRRLGIVGDVDDAAGNPARPTAADLIAISEFGTAEGSGSRRLAALTYLHDIGIVEAVEVELFTASTRIILSPSYRRLVEAGREPDREPGFDAAWDAGGPPAVRAWLEAEAQKLDADEPAADADAVRGSHPPGGSAADIPPVDYRGLRDLIQEVYGEEGQRFLDTPRRSLDGRTPRQALRDGDIDAVWEVAIAGVVGAWS